MQKRRKKLEKKPKKKNGTGAASGIPVNQYTARSLEFDDKKNLTITLPERLDFENNYEETASHFALIRSAVSSKRRIKSLKFDKIKYISPAAALVLASEVDRWNQKTAGRLKADLPSWDESIQRLLCQMGYFELLRLSKPDTQWPAGSTTFLQFKRGRVSEREGGQHAKQLRIEIEALVGGKIGKHFLFEGLSEAITNAGQHAYRTVTGLTLKQWWLSASFDRDSSRLCVMFFDQGEGIPRTLPRAEFFETIKDVFSAWTDAEKIKAAMEVGRTSTKHSERGKGLQNLLEFAKRHREGQLSIYSLRGMFRQSYSGENNEPSIMLKNLETTVGGTLIEWSVKLDYQ